MDIKLNHLCLCEQATEDTKHYLLECTLYEEQREEMINSIELSYVQNDTLLALRVINVPTLLGGNHELTNLVANHDILEAVGFFLEATRQGV